MKKQLLALSLILNTGCCLAENIAVIKVGETVFTTNKVIQHVVFNSNLTNIDSIVVKADTPEIVNLNNPNITIPVSSVFLIKNGIKYQLGQSRETILPVSLNEIANTPLIISIENGGNYEAGIYNLKLRFSTIKNGESESSMIENFVYDATFNLKNNLNITSTTKQVKFSLTSEEIFNKNLDKKNDIDTHINVEANTKWKLCLLTGKLDLDKGDYYFYVKNSSPKFVTNSIQNKTRLEENQVYELASGLPNKKVTTNGYEPSGIIIQYSFKNKTDKDFIPEGDYIKQIKYKIEEMR